MSGRNIYRSGPLESGFFHKIEGSHKSIGTFVIPNGKQESLTGDGNNISTHCYHTKLYTTDKDISLNLSHGLQDGQLLSLTYIFQGSNGSVVTVNCPTLIGDDSVITFTNVGDNIELLWNSGNWITLKTINTSDPTLLTPLLS